MGLALEALSDPSAFPHSHYSGNSVIIAQRTPAMCTVSIMVTPAAYLLSCTGTPPGPVTCVPSAHFLLQQLHCLPIYHTPGIILLCGNLCTRTPSWVSFLLLKSYPFLTLNHYAVPQTFVKMIFLCLRLAHGAGLGVCSAGGRGRDA